MPYGEVSPYSESGLAPRMAPWPHAARRPGFRVVVASLALATMMAFVAGVGSTVTYFKAFKDDV